MIFSKLSWMLLCVSFFCVIMRNWLFLEMKLYSIFLESNCDTWEITNEELVCQLSTVTPVIASEKIWVNNVFTTFRDFFKTNGRTFGLYPGRLTWNLKITYLKRKIIFQTSIIMFHVNLRGCIPILAYYNMVLLFGEQLYSLGLPPTQ